MKRLFFVSLSFILALTISAVETIKVDFESGIPDGWIYSGVALKSDNGSTRAAMSTNSTLVTVAIPNLTYVEYKHRGSGNNKQIVVEKSLDGGVTWTQIGTTNVSSSSTYASSGHAVDEADAEGVKIRFTCMSATIYIDDIILTSGTSSGGEVDVPTTPTIQLGARTIDFGKTQVGTDRIRTVKIAAVCLEPTAGTITINSNSDVFTLSSDGVNFSSSVSFDYEDAILSEKSFTIKFSPVSYIDYSDQLSLNGGGATATLPIKGLGSETSGNEYYIAPDGNDVTGDGTIENPWMNLQNVVNIAQPGDVIICRGGTYHFTTRDSSNKLTVRIKTSGTAEAPITIKNYDGEVPIFDFKQQLLDCNRDRSKVGDRGMQITGNYWVLYGLHITHAADNGIKLEGSYNRIERCEFSYNLDTGLQLGFGHNFSDSGYGSSNNGNYCAYNDIIDCDSHHNCDFDTNYGSDADGFACKMHNGIGNRFIRCRAWRNGDDAWDLYETDYSVTLIECWAWQSGKAEDHTWVYDYFDKGPNFSGNGNGIKLGGNGTGGSSKGVHYAYNCVAFGCDKSGSTKGFDCNSHKDGHVLVGCLGFDNGYDFMFESGGGSNSQFYNNVCFGRQEILVGTESNNAYLGTPQAGKTFINNVVSNFSRADYESLSEADALAPRGIDGSMPTKFARLKSNSKLIDAGLDKVIPYIDEFPFLNQPICGLARDLGPYESTASSSTGLQAIKTHESSDVFSLSSGSGNNEVIALISCEKKTQTNIDIYTTGGLFVKSVPVPLMEPAVDYYIPLDITSLSKGVYICKISLSGKAYTGRIIKR